MTEARDLRRLIVRGQDNPYQEDIDRIVAVCEARGYTIDPADARSAWRLYSETMAAGWMELPDDDDMLFHRLSQHTTEPSHRF